MKDASLRTLQVVLSGGSASRLMEEIEQALQKVPSLANGMIPEQVARIEQEIKDARRELLAKPADPLPSSLPTKIFVPPLRGKSISEAKDERCRDAMEESERAVGEAVALLDAAADLEANSEWADVVELDSAEAPGEDTKMDWEFDAAALRKRRQDGLWASFRKPQMLFFRKPLLFNIQRMMD